MAAEQINYLLWMSDFLPVTSALFSIEFVTATTRTILGENKAIRPGFDMIVNTIVIIRP